MTVLFCFDEGVSRGRCVRSRDVFKVLIFNFFFFAFGVGYETDITMELTFEDGVRVHLFGSNCGLEVFVWLVLLFLECDFAFLPAVVLAKNFEPFLFLTKLKL